MRILQLYSIVLCQYVVILHGLLYFQITTTMINALVHVMKSETNYDVLVFTCRVGVAIHY